MTVAARATRTTKPKPAITRDRYHRYTFEGSVYPGVTSLIKVVDKSDVLMRWAARNTAEAAILQAANLPSLLETSGKEGVIRLLAERSSWKRDAAADLGTDLHGYADRISQGEDIAKDTVPDEAWARASGYAEWWKASGWRRRITEAYIVNRTLGYGGTIDLLAYDEEGRTVLADVKSGKGVYGETILQLVGYGMAEMIAPADSPVAYPMPAIDRYAVLHVTDAGVRVIDLEPTEEDRAAFRACIPLSAWQKAHKDAL